MLNKKNDLVFFRFVSGKSGFRFMKVVKIISWNIRFFVILFFDEAPQITHNHSDRCFLFFSIFVFLYISASVFSYVYAFYFLFSFFLYLSLTFSLSFFFLFITFSIFSSFTFVTFLNYLCMLLLHRVYLSVPWKKEKFILEHIE